MSDYDAEERGHVHGRCPSCRRSQWSDDCGHFECSCGYSDTPTVECKTCGADVPAEETMTIMGEIYCAGCQKDLMDEANGEGDDD